MAEHRLPFLSKDKANFEAICDGRKTIETRAGSQAYLTIQVGDVLILECDGQSVERSVKKVKHFKKVDDLYDSPDFDVIMPGSPTLAQVKAAYLSYPGYPERLDKYGILAFYIGQ